MNKLISIIFACLFVVVLAACNGATTTTTATTATTSTTETTLATTATTVTTATTATTEQVISTIYFYNSQSWDAVSAYIWGDPGEVFGGWPGTVATQDGDTNWWSVDVPVNAATTTFNIIFNNNGGGSQSDYFINNATNVYLLGANNYSSKETAEATLTAPVVTTRIYYYNSEAWTTVDAYVYGDASGSVLGSWPGTAATQDGSTDWWYVDVNVDAATVAFNIIFNNNDTLQHDLYIANATSVYLTATAAFDSKDAAEASLVS